MYLGAVCPFSHDSVCVSKGFLFSECDDKSARRAVVFSWPLVWCEWAHALAVAEGLCEPASQPYLNIEY